MYSKKTRVHCYAFTLLPALIGLVLWSTNPQTVFPLVVLFTPVLLALTLALCLHLTEKLEKDREKNKKINSVVIWIIPVLSNVTFWISYAVAVQRMEVPVLRILSWLFAAMYLVLGNYMPKCRRHPGQMDRLQRRKLERYPPSGGAMLYGLRLFDDSHQLSAGKSGFGLPDRASGSGKCHSHGLFLCLL